MLTKARVVTISKLALPVSIALSSTMVMSLIDLAMVRSLGSQATAAVGLSVFSHTLLLAFVAGIAPAIQGLVARRRGQRSLEALCLPLNGGLATALVDMLAEAALPQGVHTFNAIYRAENRPVTALHDHADSTGQLLISHGIAEFDVTLDHDRVIAAIRHLHEEAQA